MAPSKKVMVGRQLLDVITSGMYDNPLMIYREYVQNAVDSIDQMVANDQGKLVDTEINILIDGKQRTIVIEDNGAGLSEIKAGHILQSLGLSPKESGGSRGFRGIGRLGGLGYCDSLKFETRASKDERVTEVLWSRLKLDALAQSNDRTSLEDALEKIVDVSKRPAVDNDPDRFFRVTLGNVRRFHSDQVMQISKVRSYLEQVAPVPFSNEFSLGETLDKLSTKIPGYHSYNITVNNQQIFRSYENRIEFSENCEDQIEEIQDFEILGINNEVIAAGWFAKLKYLGALPQNNNMRGIRIRQGNIEIGGEHCLAEHFSERRFATWQVGEIHVAVGALKANARRDGFENSVNYEKLLEFSTRLGKHLSKACRQESRNRNHYAKAINCIERIKENLFQNSIYIDTDHFDEAKKCLLTELETVKNDVNRYSLPLELVGQIETLEDLILNEGLKANMLVDILNAAQFKNKTGKKVIIEFIKGVVKNKGRCREIDEILLKSLSACVTGGIALEEGLEFSTVGI